jgi:hypothetical protein
MALYRLALAMNRCSNRNSLLLILTVVILYILFTPVTMYADSYGGYIGLFTDEQRSGFSVETAPNIAFDMWIFIIPLINGAIAVEFSVRYCDNVVRVEESYSPLIVGFYGDLYNGFHANFEECQSEGEWVWVARQTLYVTDDQGCEIRVGGVSGAPFVSDPIFLGCDDNLYLLSEWCGFYITVPVSTGSSSWGAIKSLYK